jgi:hypothetical protein
MRVPTYQRQTATTAKTGAINFSVRANPGALAAGQRAVGDLFAAVENTALSWYEQEQKLKRQESLSQAEIELDNALETLKTEQRNRNPMLILDGDPAKNELSFGELAQQELDRIASGLDDKRVRNAFISGARQTVNRKQISVNQDARNRLIDQRAATALQAAAKLEDQIVMGNGADRAEANLKLFGGQDSNGTQVIGAYYQMAADGLITNVKAQQLTRSAEKNVRERKREADAAILDINTGKRVLIAGDINQPISAREAAVKDGVEAITAAVENNTITRDKAEELLAKATDDTVRSIGLGLMTSSSDATGTALAIFSGNVELDPILSDMLGTMDPSDRTKVMNDFFTIATKIDTERREQEEAEEEKADQANVNMFDAIINVDTTSESSMALALDMHKMLLQRNWYNATQRKAAETILGLNKSTKPEQVETSAEAVRILNRADNDNILTLDLVEKYAGQLSTTDYNAFFKRAIAEGRDGRTAGKALISSKLRYNEFKDSNNALGDAADMMFQQSMFELDDWLNTPKADGGGMGATYQEVVAKARDINTNNETQYQKMMKEAFIGYLQSSQTLVPNLPVDLDNPVASAKEWLATQNQSDPIIRGITQTIQSYVKIGVR